jgi:hypothetical protein
MHRQPVTRIPLNLRGGKVHDEPNVCTPDHTGEMQRIT